MLGSLTVADVMNPHVQTVTPETDVLTAARIIHDEGIGSVLAVDDGDIVGVLTESDIVGLLAEGEALDALTVGDVASSPVETIDADASLQAAADRHREHGVKKLPVVDDGRLVGICSTAELSYFLPHIVHAGGRDVSEDARHRRERVDTAYEKADWEFESHGVADDSIDVGDTVSFSKPITDDDVEAFADASGDTNRLHLDDDYAAGTRFGGRIAHGTLVVGVVSAALARLPGLVVYISQNVSYLGPVEVGDRVTADCEVVEALGDDRYRLTTSVTADGDTVVDGEAVVLGDPIPDTA